MRSVTAYKRRIRGETERYNRRFATPTDTLALDENGLREEQFEVSGKLVPGLSAIPWALDTDAGSIVPGSAAFGTGKAEPQ